MNVEQLMALFPTEAEIPEEFQIKEPIRQTEYLANGELRIWQGPIQDVLSPVCVKGSTGVARKLLGSYPMLTETEVLSILDTAIRAYDNGKGTWPTMPVAVRIRHIQDFACRMKLKKNEIVKLLMWEIGKSYTDSVKEFDRTMEYIEDTIDALKDLDRVSSRFQIEQSIIAQVRRSPLGVVLYGPIQLSFKRDFHHPDPRPDHGKHHHL